MFIRKVPHKNKKNRREYFTYKLVESVRTERGPRQRDVLNLGVRFDLPRKQWKELANCIEGTLTGQRPLFDYPKKISTLARKYAREITRQQAQAIGEAEDVPSDYQVVDVNSVDNEDIRSVGAEHVVYETMKQLGLDRKLRSFGLTRMQLALTMGVIAGRMIAPGSERATHQWLLNRSGLDELMGVDLSNVSLDSVYKASDILLKNQDALEEHLRRTEGQLFALDEKIILYDLTNTFIEGTGKYNPKARYGGKSKEKRSDCPLVTLGLVLDVQGFPKKSRIYEGNVSEPKTLEAMIDGLSIEDRGEGSLFKPTIILDAGIATEDNIEWLKGEEYRYIVVSRKKKTAIPPDVSMVAVKQDDRDQTVLVEAGLSKNKDADELKLYCHSVDKEKKEEGIKNKFQERFEFELMKARNALDLKNGTKRYDKVLERIGRLKERYRSVARGYKIAVEKDRETDKAKDIKWSRKETEKTSGVYCLRTNREDLDVQQIWDIYTMLTDIEDAFRCMKSELGLRPIHHQKEVRCDGHIFITVIAYHLMHTIRHKLRHRSVRFCWTTIRRQLSTQVRTTTTMKREDNKVIRIRKSSKAEPVHEVIYDALNLSHRPGRIEKTIL
ncbi:MAG: IS1634 family transposase [Desulfobacterales bacterium]